MHSFNRKEFTLYLTVKISHLSAFAGKHYLCTGGSLATNAFKSGVLSGHLIFNTEHTTLTQPHDYEYVDDEEISEALT